MGIKVRQIKVDEPEVAGMYPFGFFYMHENQRCDEIIKWCEDQFGEFSFKHARGRMACDIGPILRYVLFRDQLDAIAFKLRWM
jgi:hypothetical protein